MKSSNKTDTHFYFIILQWTLNKPFKCDCASCKKNTVSALFKNGKFDLTSPSSKPTWHTEFQYETRPVLKHRLCCFFVLKYSWRHSKRAPSRDQNLKGILTPGNFVQQVSFDAWNINPLSQTLLRHLKPSQSCNGCRLYFGVFFSV